MARFAELVARYRTYKDRNLWLNVAKDRESLAWWKENGEDCDQGAIRRYTENLSALKRVIGERAAHRCRKSKRAVQTCSGEGGANAGCE